MTSEKRPKYFRGIQGPGIIPENLCSIKDKAWQEAEGSETPIISKEEYNVLLQIAGLVAQATGKHSAWECMGEVVQARLSGESPLGLLDLARKL